MSRHAYHDTAEAASGDTVLRYNVSSGRLVPTLSGSCRTLPTFVYIMTRTLLDFGAAPWDDQGPEHITPILRTLNFPFSRDPVIMTIRLEWPGLGDIGRQSRCATAATCPYAVITPNKLLCMSGEEGGL